MPNARAYQIELKNKLNKHFKEVDFERSVVTEAEDALRFDPIRYAPRLDLVIGPYNLRVGNYSKDSLEIKNELFSFKKSGNIKFFDVISSLTMNRNPRYAVAIEIVFSGSSKHVLGDITNASTLGLYGFVITSENMLPKAKRILNHLQTLKGLEKISPDMFNNVTVVSFREFSSYFK